MATKKTTKAATTKTTTKATTKAAAVAPETAAKAAAPEEKKTAKKAACKTSVCVEMSGLSVTVADIQTAVKKAVKEKGLEASELNIYINAAEQAAYYTVNGVGGEDCKVDLKAL